MKTEIMIWRIWCWESQHSLLKIIEWGKSDLHRPRDALSVTEDFVKVLGTQNVPQSSLGQQPEISISMSSRSTVNWPGAVVSVLHVGHTDGGVADPVVDHRVHWHRHAVLGQYLNHHKMHFFMRINIENKSWLNIHWAFTHLLRRNS